MEEILDDSYQSGFVSNVTKGIYTVLYNLLPNKEIKNLYKIAFDKEQSMVKITSDETPLIFYNTDLSLFLGVIKYLGLNIPMEVLKTELLKTDIVLPKE
jgi:hypothetical protein